MTRQLRLGAAQPARRSRRVALLHAHLTERTPSRHEVLLLQAGCTSFRLRVWCHLARRTTAAARLPALCLHRFASGRRRGWTLRCGGSRTARSASMNWSTTRCAFASARLDSHNHGPVSTANAVSHGSAKASVVSNPQPAVVDVLPIPGM